MEEVSLLADAVVFLSVIFLLFIFAIFLYLRRLNRIMAQRVAEMWVELEEKSVGLEIELEQGIYYCYDSRDKTFVCQGRNASEIALAFRARYPDKIGYLADPSKHQDLLDDFEKIKQDNDLRAKAN